jgi:hypothetical protein
LRNKNIIRRGSPRPTNTAAFIAFVYTAAIEIGLAFWEGIKKGRKDKKVLNVKATFEAEECKLRQEYREARKMWEGKLW